MSEPSSSVVKSVGRVFEVFELFDEIKEPATATRIGRSLNYPQSSTIALLKSMVQLGYLSFDALERTYFPTMRISMLGQWIEESLYGEAGLTQLIAEIAEATGETVSLSCQNDLKMQFIHIQLGTQPLTLALKAGAVAPLFWSTVGWAALAEQTDAEIERLLERFNRLTRAKSERLALADVVEKVRIARAQGYAVGHNTYIPGVAAIAWVLPQAGKRRPVVLSIGGPSERLRVEEADIVRVVTDALARFKASRNSQPRGRGKSER
jgi:IclR family transcriptional regulator, KDG regulon repressor